MPQWSMVHLVNLAFLISLMETGASAYYKNENAGLTSVPDNIPVTSERISLIGNALTTITNADFSLFTQLATLELQNNNISSIAQDAFNNTVLKNLKLSSNPIKTIPIFAGIESTLQYLIMLYCQISNTTWDNIVHYTSLVDLQLDFNQITSVPNVTKSAARLTKLTLSRNNIEVFDAAKLDGCTSLISLSAQKNGMRYVKGVLKLPKLRSLDFRDNKLNQFPNISYLRSLNYFALQDNKIQSIPNDSFVHNNLMQFTYLQNNYFKQMPNLDGAELLHTFIAGNNKNITVIPIDYFNGCNKLTKVSLDETSITSLSFVRSFGPSVESLDIMNSKIIGDIPAGTFANATGLKQLLMFNNEITSFDMSNIKYMPLLVNLNIPSNRLTTIGNAYAHCRGAACTSLNVNVKGNPIPCDKDMCWAKMNTTITVERDQCSGTNWNGVSLDDLPCPQREQIMKLTEKQGYNSRFQKKYELLDYMYDYKKTDLGRLDLMQCIGACLTTDGCHYLKHGNSTSYFSFSETMDCIILTHEPRQ